MRWEADPGKGAVTLEAPKSMYSLEGVRIAAAVFEGRAEASVSEDAKLWEIALVSRRKGLGAAELESLGGEFLNELLNQEYRFVVGRFNRKISDLIATQALLAARGGENPPDPPSGEKTPQFQEEVSRMVREAQDEVRRTMPKRIPPQGLPIPPQNGGAGA